MDQFNNLNLKIKRFNTNNLIPHMEANRITQIAATQHDQTIHPHQAMEQAIRHHIMEAVKTQGMLLTQEIILVHIIVNQKFIKVITHQQLKEEMLLIIP